VRIEDYAIIGDTQTAALVGRTGSIDWLCFPRFDSAACFAALLGDARHGRWSIAPCEVATAEQAGAGAAAPGARARRRYRDGSLVLETEWTTSSGVARVVDCMPPRGKHPDVVRLVEGVAGEVRMLSELLIRFDYGRIVPWVRRKPGGIHAVAGPDAICFTAGVPTHGERLSTVSEFTVRPGDRVPFVLTWHPSHEPAPERIDVEDELRSTEAWWREWSSRGTYDGPYAAMVQRSLMVLKALTYAPTGGIVAAPTTSLPEWPGGVRNWDYRYCWLRDATLALYALMLGGYTSEAAAWRDWLLRAVAGDPAHLQIMYGLGGERRLPEFEAHWLDGYEGSRPVRVGNAAVEQRQLDVYGEVMDTLYEARRAGLQPDQWTWGLQLKLLERLEELWHEPDEGIWEVRGPRRHFTHSKVLAWVAFDRAVKSVEQQGQRGPVEHWRRVRDAIHADVCRRAFDPRLGAFTQAYGAETLDAGALVLPLVGFLPVGDPRVASTVAAIERRLVRDGFVLRYDTELDVRGGRASGEGETIDGLPPGEGAFLACSFWLADVMVLQGRESEAERLLGRLVAVANDVGLLAEQYDPRSGRQLGNFPQAFSHLSLVNTACNLSRSQVSPAAARGT
jgi:GH15 family glucan-1,4-alpha-glucosidase